VDRVPQGVPLWSSVGKPGDLGDRPADKISVRSDQGLEIEGICRLDHWNSLLLLLMDCFLDAILLYAPSGQLSDL